MASKALVGRNRYTQIVSGRDCGKKFARGGLLPLRRNVGETQQGVSRHRKKSGEREEQEEVGEDQNDHGGQGLSAPRL